MSDDLIIVHRKDLLDLLDYVQEDEERDVSMNPDDSNHHIIYTIRRLREEASTEDSWPILP